MKRYKQEMEVYLGKRDGDDNNDLAAPEIAYKTEEPDAKKAKTEEKA
jgi:hypothetical protein